MAQSVDCVVAGAGVVGLAVARALALAGREVLVLEAEPLFGTGISSRSSEVIHAGLYYSTGTLKARTCVAGRRALYAYAEARGIPHRRTGKLIVAADAAERAQLETLAARGAANDVEGLRMISSAEARAMEPELRCTAALLSETTGIVDSHALMLAFQGDLQAAGGMVVTRAPIKGGTVQPDRVSLRVGGREPMALETRLFVNAAGLAAPALARSLDGLSIAAPEPLWCKGSYFVLSGHAPFSRLIYPLPEVHGLGVHLTLDLAGQARFGPDTEWPDRLDFEVDGNRASEFEAAVRRYWPGLPKGALRPGYAGIRPKIAVGSVPCGDFLIRGPEVHGSPIVALYGIDSPGLTAAMALGDLVAAIVR